MAPLLDLGFSSFEAIEKMEMNAISRSLYQQWVCDWELISFIDKVSFICDATMYKLYCAEYDIACDYSDEECAELATKYKDQLYAFQRDLLFQLIDKIKTKWINYVVSGKIQPKLPPTAKTSLLNFVTIVNKMAESYVQPHFISLFASLSEAHKERTSKDMDVSDVQETITKDQFDEYCKIFNPSFVKLFQFKDGSLDQKLFNVRIGIVKKILMSILWMCEPEVTNRIYAPDLVFDRWIFPYIEMQEACKEMLGAYVVRKSIPMAYALCVTPETIKMIPEDTDSYPITDSFRFMVTLLFTTQPVEQ